MAAHQPGPFENMLLKPYFWRRPSQLLRRVRYARFGWPDPPAVRLPWGLTLMCYPGETIGESVVRTGVFEMTTSEALVRLIDPGETVLDVGANVGYMTSLVACAVGGDGCVIAYEPNPVVFERLAYNAGKWRGARLGAIKLRKAALSDRSGSASLTVPHGGSEYAALAERPTARAGTGPHTLVQVETATLDDELDGEAIGMLKLDVEDHEPAALRGARRLLEAQTIRDVLFEDHHQYPSETTETLEQHGFSVFDLASRPRGVVLRPSSAQMTYASWDAPMRLATLDPERALQRLARPGWFSLRHPRRWPQSARR